MSTLSIPVPTISTGPKNMTDTEAAEHYLREMRDRTKMLQAGSGVTALVNRLLDDVLDAMEALNAAADTPTPERVTLTDEEREAVVAVNHCTPDGKIMEALVPVIERILAAREQALREESWEACWSSIAEAAWPEGGATRSEVLSLVLGARPAGDAR